MHQSVSSSRIFHPGAIITMPWSLMLSLHHGMEIASPRYAQSGARHELRSYAAYFGIPVENVVIRSPFLGGGFGSKAIINGPQMLAIAAARQLNRPVKLALSRAQMYGPVGHRGQTWQTLRMGMDENGKLRPFIIAPSRPHQALMTF